MPQLLDVKYIFNGNGNFKQLSKVLLDIFEIKLLTQPLRFWFNSERWCLPTVYRWHGCTGGILAKCSSISLNIEGEFTLDIWRCWRRVFLVAVPALWNMIQLKLQLATNFVEFKKALKTILFWRPLDTQGLHNWTFIGSLFPVTIANIALLTVTNERLLFWLVCSYTLSRVAHAVSFYKDNRYIDRQKKFW